jgi:hypothetical protein
MITLLEAALPIYDALYAWRRAAQSEPYRTRSRQGTSMTVAAFAGPACLAQALRSCLLGFISFGGRPPDRNCIASWWSRGVYRTALCMH